MLAKPTLDCLIRIPHMIVINITFIVLTNVFTLYLIKIFCTSLARLIFYGIGGHA